MAGVHHQHRRFVVGDVGVDRSDEADVVGHLANVWKQLADVHPRLAVFLERKRRPHQGSGLALGRDRAARERLAVILVEHRLRIEAVNLGQSAVHEQKNHPLCARRMVKLANVEAVLTVVAATGTGTEQRLVDEAREGEHPKSIADPTERVAARNWTLGMMAHAQFTNKNSLELRRILA